MNRSLLSRSAGWFLFVGAVAGTGSTAVAQPQPSLTEAEAALPDVVVSATRSPQDPRYTPSAVSVVPLADLALAQVPDLREALAREPGVVVVTTGPVGGQASIFLRGASSHQTLFVVDGVRMSDRSASYTNFLGGADVAGLERIEVLRGPQSTLYGSSALGGVILLETAHGLGAPGGSVAVSVGSFDTWSAGAAVEGSADRWGYSFAVSRFETENDAPNNGFEQWSYNGRLEFAVSDALTFGGTFRRVEGDFEEVGSRFWPSQAAVGSDTLLGTAYAQWQAGENFRSRLTLARHERDYVYEDTWARSVMGNVRRIVEWQNTWQATDALEVVAGANYERSRYTIAGSSTRDEVTAGYATATWRVQPAVTVTAGVRHDDYDTFGDATTERVGVSWLVLPSTKLRATYGTGFSAPGSDDRFGVPSWGQRPNPDLVAEESTGWDVGIDHEFRDGLVSVSASYFHNRFRNLLEWETVDFTTFEGRIVNRARASTEGVELAVVTRPVDGLQTRLAYTYLDAENDIDHTRLVRRPRHVIDAEIRAQPVAAWAIGAGVRHVRDRLDAGQRMDDFSTVRVFTSFAPRSDLTFKVRVENALDEEYEEVLGYPSLPRGVFGSVEWTF